MAALTPEACRCEPIGLCTVPTYGPCDEAGGRVQTGWECQACGHRWPLWRKDRVK